MRAETREKVRRLRDSATFSGEKAAADAALDRMEARPDPPRPAFGTPEYIAAISAHREIIGFCSLHRDVESLTRDEVKMIRNFTRYGGDPWESGAAELRSIAAKIRRAGRE